MLNSAQNGAAVEVTGGTDLETLRGLFEEAQRLLQAGQAHEALTPIREILRCSPDHPDALNFASVAFGQLKMMDDAVRFSQLAIAARPMDAGFQLNLANRLRDQGQVDEALETYDRAAALDPTHLPTLKSQLRCLAAEERWPEAQSVAEKLAPLATGDVDLLTECAEVCICNNDRADALKHCQAALDVEPERLPLLVQAARLAMLQDEVKLAKALGERVLDLEDNAEMHAMLASIMHRVSDYDAMAKHLAAVPDDSNQAANAANLMGMMLMSQGKAREGLDFMERTAALAPDAFELQATRVMFKNYDPDISTDDLRDHHFALGRHFGNTLPEMDSDGLARLYDPERRLRIGFVSPDLRAHSVAFFIQPYLSAFDRERFEVYAYAHLAREDTISLALRENVTCWRNIFTMTNSALAEQIRKDQVDILIDLAGLTRDTRILAFTARPAPIQMTYIGYPNTTGFSAIDYRITDGIADPDGTDDQHSETLIRLPGCFLCYAIPEHAPPVEPGPSEHRDYVTFGSFNNFTKVNPETVALWADVLNAVPGSRLLCKSQSSKDQTAQSVIRQGLEKAGIDPGRISFSSFRKTQESHLSVYHDIDIALDTFPYNGTTTTCEALWMGVPVVTLCGERHASRVSASLLSTIGFPAGIAESRDEYVLTARLLAETPGMLRMLRRTLRDSVMRSPLCDSRFHAERLENAFRTVWRAWCEQRTQ